MVKTVNLTKPLTGHRGKVDSLQFREPTFEDVMTLGSPVMPMSIGGGRYLPQPVPSIVKDYAERLLVAGDGMNVMILGQANLRDSLAIQRVILGFFEEAEAEADTPTTSAA